jgi:tetratricopeptide (TPR) repeat protein
MREQLEIAFQWRANIPRRNSGDSSAAKLALCSRFTHNQVMESLAGHSLFIHGRLHGVTKRRIASLVERAGGVLTARPSARTTHIVVGHVTAAIALVSAPPVAFPDGTPAGAYRLSELAFKRRIGLAAPPTPETRTFTREHLLGQMKFDQKLIECLELFDVLEPVAGLFSYRDLACAREVSRLLSRGIALDEIVMAATHLSHRGLRLCEAHLTEAPWGTIVQQLGGRLMELDGQFTLPLDEAPINLYDAIAQAEVYEASGAWAEAERLYRIAMRMDRSDPVLPFNLGNVLDAKGEEREAILSYQTAVARAPEFADAWYNLAVISGRQGRTDEASRYYRAALQAHPDYEDALHNLALLLTKAGNYSEALPLWERLIAIAPQTSRGARESALLCRLEIAAAENAS